MNTYNQEKLRTIFQHGFDMSTWMEMLQNYFQSKELKDYPESISNTEIDIPGYYLGAMDTKDSYRVGLFYYTLEKGSVTKKRVGLRNLVKSFINPTWGMFDAALVVFDSGDHWRLSLVCDIKEKNTHSKRYTYVFGNEELRYRTPVERFTILQKKGISFNNMLEAFSVEALSDEFFDKYREKYANFIEYITGKRFIKKGGKWVEELVSEPNEQLMSNFNHNEKNIRDYVKKMMGRITFLHFLQRKGWMNSDLNYMQNLFNRSACKSDYLDAVLEPLFFGILNTKSEEREDLFIRKNWDKSLLQEWMEIPYLNGGLFEADENDDASCGFPPEYFEDLFNFFSEYNFTIDENDPNDAEVGVDPEMLGKIFENLLEDNKDKGAFYTPKEIVRYMCQESLIAYLETNTSIAAEKIRNFVICPEEGVSAIPDSKKSKLESALEEVKICDPAIGSGAFPMGLLNALLHCREVLSDSHYNRSELKKNIIQNNIYGVDIEKGAVDIARLRFWLSIVVDEETPSPLPNLDYKIMQGNSLLENFMGIDLSNLSYEKESPKDSGEISLFDDEKNRLQKIIYQILFVYYSCANHQHKLELQNKISNTIRKQLESQNYSIEVLNSLEKLDLAANNKFFLWHTWYSDVFNREKDKKGFDIVIGNPPYFVYQESHVGEIQDLRKDSDYSIAFGGKLNAYKLFLANAITKLLNVNGINCFIFQNSFLGDRQATNLRKHILHNKKILKIDSFPERDSKKKRVFESVKMSVCISLIQNTEVNPDYEFPVFIWDDKNKTSGINTSFSLNDILAIDNIDYTIPRLQSKDKPLVIKLLRKKELEIKCIEGELNVTFHQKYFGTNACDPIILKGASIQRFYYTLQMSQGQIDYVKESDYLKNCGNSPKSQHHNFKRIAMQGMTGANDKVRLVMSIIPQGYYLANSCNYILPSVQMNLYCLLGFLNSKTLNWFFRCFSTNSNVNGYEVENFPIPILEEERQEEISSLVKQIISTKEKENNENTLFLEDKIDRIIYQSYDLTPEEIKIIEDRI